MSKIIFNCSRSINETFLFLFKGTLSKGDSVQRGLCPKRLRPVSFSRALCPKRLRPFSFSRKLCPKKSFAFFYSLESVEG